VPAPNWLLELERFDAELYAAVADTDIPPLDRAMHRLSEAANYSRLWIAIAGLLWVAGGQRGRRAAVDGLVSIAATSAIVNAGLKPLGRRRRPERGPLLARHVRMPKSRSFPSGHAASAFAFATGVAGTHPRIAVPLRGLATLVAYSRVHTGVHFPGDVVAGALVGTAVAPMARLQERPYRLRPGGGRGGRALPG
jgi:membrane-associated phospholipid phosphatase